MDKKLVKFITIMYIIALTIMVGGVTYAFFTKILVSNVSPKVEVTTATTDFLAFSVGDPIRITPNGHNFGEKMGNLVSTTHASVELKAAQERASYHYNLFLNIDKNDLEYSTESRKPELIFQITDPEGNEVTNIFGLDYVTVTDGKGEEVRGFDITTAIGKYNIVNNFEISTDDEVKHQWNVTIIFVNLEESQNANYEKDLEGYIQIEKV